MAAGGAGLTGRRTTGRPPTHTLPPQGGEEESMMPASGPAVNSDGAAAPEGASGQALPPLNISGVVLSKAQLITALAVYIPAIADLQPLPGGEHYYVLFTADGSAAT